MPQRLRARLDAVAEGRQLERELRVVLHAVDAADVPGRERGRVGGVDTDAQRERMQPAAAVQQRRVVGEQPHARERAAPAAPSVLFPPPEGSITATPPAAPASPSACRRTSPMRSRCSPIRDTTKW